MATKIEWTDETWNPIAGCNDVSEGCRNCYARRMAGRLEAMGVAKYAGLTVLQGSHRVWTGKISFDEKALLAPLGQKKPTRYFVNSMSDLFHENVTKEMLDRIFAVMALCPQHTFQVLTKRPERMLAYLTGPDVRGGILRHILRIEETRRRPNCQSGRTAMRRAIADSRKPLPEFPWPLPNVWLGVSVEDQKAADERLDYLCELASLGWQTMVSFEPLLSAVDPGEWWLSLGSRTWAIVGGESGPGARPMHPDWARSLRDQCVAAGVPFFFKQRGEWVSHISAFDRSEPLTYLNRDGRTATEAAALADGGSWHGMYRVGKKAAGHLLDGREWHQFPEVSR